MGLERPLVGLSGPLEVPVVPRSSWAPSPLPAVKLSPEPMSNFSQPGYMNQAGVCLGKGERVGARAPTRAV